jgi:hypothetical protein
MNKQETMAAGPKKNERRLRITQVAHIQILTFWITLALSILFAFVIFLNERPLGS